VTVANTEYVNNETLLRELIVHRKAVRKAKRDKKETPLLNDYIGTCFLKIADHMSRKPRFLYYSFRQDMISEAVELCVRYVNNFDPAKSKNPFAYFTQITYHAFFHRINKERKQLYLRYKSTELLGLLQESPLHDTQNLGREGGKTFKVYENISDFIQTFEQARKQKKRRKPVRLSTRGTLKHFIGDK
jgi:hypothetical protein